MDVATAGDANATAMVSTGVILTAVGFQKSGRLTKPADLQAPGARITLEPDPDNPFDPHAVKVLLNDAHAAYVCRTDTHDAKAVLGCQRAYTVTAPQAYAASVTLVVTVPGCTHNELLSHIT